MSKNHNKKRNVGIIYELLLRSISASLVEGKSDEAQKALNILNRRFSKDTELYSEFRLFKALCEAQVSDTVIAASILTEAKTGARNLNNKKLFNEKSALIKDINSKIEDDEFYRRKVSNYTEYATVQTVMNDWMQNDKSDLARQIQYEQKLINMMISEKKEDAVLNEMTNPDVNNLVVELMTQKINQKYGDSLTLEQKTILKNFAFCSGDDHDPDFVKWLSNLKESTLRLVDSYESSCDNNIVLEKIEFVKEKISSLKPENPTEDEIVKFLTVSSLKEEIRRQIK
jgi:hypothetical protein